jgi:hypothetical protein
MGILRLSLISFVLCCFISCDSAEKLVLPREELTSNFRIDGYYYNKKEGGYSTYFFYKNGVVFTYGCGYTGNDLKELDICLQKLLAKYSTIKPARFDWGIYLINGTNIKIEKWVSTAASTYPTNLFEGQLIGDEKFTLTKQTGNEYYVKKNKTISEISLDFNFRQFSPKPDSTNKFIK